MMCQLPYICTFYNTRSLSRTICTDFPDSTLIVCTLVVSFLVIQKRDIIINIFFLSLFHFFQHIKKKGGSQTVVRMIFFSFVHFLCVEKVLFVAIYFFSFSLAVRRFHKSNDFSRHNHTLGGSHYTHSLKQKFTYINFGA